MQARRPSLLGSPKLQIGQLLCAAACQDHQHLWQGASRAGRAWHSGSRHKQPPLIQAASRRVPRTQTVKLDRAVAWDVRTAWKPQFSPRTSNVTDVGVEGFAMHFPWTRYPGHHDVRAWGGGGHADAGLPGAPDSAQRCCPRLRAQEKGLHGVFVNGVTDAWVRNVAMTCTDNGVNTMSECSVRVRQHPRLVLSVCCV